MNKQTTEQLIIKTIIDATPKKKKKGQESPYTIYTALFPERLRSGDKRTTRGGGAALHAGPEGGPQQHVWSQVPRTASLRSRGHGGGPQGPVAHP